MITGQETNTKTIQYSHEINKDEISATELTNTDKIRNAIAGNPAVTQKELQELSCPEAECGIFYSRCGLPESWTGLDQRKTASGF